MIWGRKPTPLSRPSRSSLPNFTLIGSTCRLCGAKNPKIGPWVKTILAGCASLLLPVTRNKSNASFEALQYRQDLFAITHYHKRTHFPSYTRCSENHNNVRRKSENPRFEICYCVVAPSGGREKNLNRGAQLKVVRYKSLQNILFLNCTA